MSANVPKPACLWLIASLLAPTSVWARSESHSGPNTDGGGHTRPSLLQQKPGQKIRPQQMQQMQQMQQKPGQNMRPPQVQQKPGQNMRPPQVQQKPGQNIRPPLVLHPTRPSAPRPPYHRVDRLPFGVKTVLLAGLTYYVLNEVYYQQQGSSYIIVDRPSGNTTTNMSRLTTLDIDGRRYYLNDGHYYQRELDGRYVEVASPLGLR